MYQPSKERRVTKKSPPPKPKAHRKLKVTKSGGCDGRCVLPNGEPYIYWWPSNRKPVDLGKVPSQTLEEAASWCVKASGSPASTDFILFGNIIILTRKPENYSHGKLTCLPNHFLVNLCQQKMAEISTLETSPFRNGPF